MSKFPLYRLGILEIPGRFPSLNDYISAERKNRHIAAKIKRDETQRVADLAANSDIPTFNMPVKIEFCWVEKNSRRDCDNVAFAKKFILDGLVKAGVLKGDSRKYVIGFTDTFPEPDKDNPHVYVNIMGRIDDAIE